jgi:hypothetical protein
MSEINGKPVIFYMLRKSEEEGESISAVTKVTRAYLHGTTIFSTDKSKINKTFKVQKDLVSKYIDEYDFTKSLDSY